MTTAFPRVLVGTPTYVGKEYCRERFVRCVKNLSYPNKNFIMVDNSKGTSYLAKLRRSGVTAVHVDRGANSRDALANASNYLRDRVLSGGYDYLLMLESDVFPNPNVIESLMSHMNTESMILQDGVRVVGAPYYIGVKQKGLCVFTTIMDKETRTVATRRLFPDEERLFLDGSLKQVHGMGVGCVLIHKSILEKYPFWYSALDDDRMSGEIVRKHPDVYFYMDLHNDRIPVYCDTSLLAYHEPSDWNVVKDI